jgi:hypothetical protein
MKTSRVSCSIAFVFVALGLVAGAGCHDKEILPLDMAIVTNPHWITVEASFCTAPPTPAKQKIKYLFVLDKSGSNQAGAPNPLNPSDVSGTDPTGARRYGPLLQFVKNMVPDPNNLTEFGLINFNDRACYPQINTSCVVPSSGFKGAFDSSQANFISLVRSEWIWGGTAQNPMPLDSGFTDYVLALNAAIEMVKFDASLEAGSIQRPLVKSTYQIIFVSDGDPVITAAGGTVRTEDFLTEILPQVNTLLSLKNDPVFGSTIANITLNTAYYFQTAQIPTAEQLLQNIANSGNGQYMAFGAGENVMYQAFAPPIRNIRYKLADVFVDNLNAVFWDDGRLMQDSDGDGLPDEIELRLGSNPRLQDSDGNGVSDLVEYRTKGKPCADASCNFARRDPYSICDGLNPTRAPDGRTSFPDTDSDGLNDCEEFILKSDKILFDSNGDFIPDFLAFKNGLPFIAGTQGVFAEPTADSLTSYSKLKLGLPMAIPSNQAYNLRKRVTTLVREDGPPGVDCYHATVENVAAMGRGNTIRFQVIQNLAIVDDIPILKSAERQVDSDEKQVLFGHGDFQ